MKRHQQLQQEHRSTSYRSYYTAKNNTVVENNNNNNITTPVVLGSTGIIMVKQQKEKETKKQQKETKNKQQQQQPQPQQPNNVDGYYGQRKDDDDNNNNTLEDISFSSVFHSAVDSNNYNNSNVVIDLPKNNDYQQQQQQQQKESLLINEQENNNNYNNIEYIEINKLREYETEAETAVFDAIEKRLLLQKIDNVDGSTHSNNNHEDEDEAIRQVLFPHIVPGTEQHIDDNDSENKSSNNNTYDQWMTLQKIGKSKSKFNSFVDETTGAMDMLLKNATTFMNAATKNTIRNGKKKKNKKKKRQASTTITTPNTPNTAVVATSDYDDDDDEGVDSDEDEDEDDNDDKFCDEIETGKRQCNNKKNKNNSKDSLLQKSIHTSLYIPKSLQKKFNKSLNQARDEWNIFEQFVIPNKETIYTYIRNKFFFIIGPSLCIAFVLFYLADNPVMNSNNNTNNDIPSSIEDENNNNKRQRYLQADPYEILGGIGELQGLNENNDDQSSTTAAANLKAIEGFNKDYASVSWWFLFIGVRHVIVWTIGRICELYFCHFLGVSSPRWMKLVGPNIGLAVAQSKGWPCYLFFYCLFAFLLLYGNTRIARHWAFWQDFLDIFNEENPAGNVTERPRYGRFLFVGGMTSLLVTIKRVWMGFHIGRRIYTRYSDNLRYVMEKLLLISEIASLPTLQNNSDNDRDNLQKVSTEAFNNLDHSNLDNSEATRHQNASAGRADAWMMDSMRPDILSLLDEWDEPAMNRTKNDKRPASLKEILEFRQSVMMLKTEYPFSVAFGPATTRAECAISAGGLYLRLRGQQSHLSFTNFATVAISKDGFVDHHKMKRLIKIFRPRKGMVISLLDFTKSIDRVYRELKTIEAAIRNATAIDRVYETLLNTLFYTVLIAVDLSIFGYEALNLGIGLASIMVAFSFVIGNAFSGIFEGILMILIRRPYDVGDRIVISEVNSETSPTGSFGWIVEEIDFFNTTVRYGLTREIATINNGSLAQSRIINLQRSDNAQIMIHLHFAFDTSHEKIILFRDAVHKFVLDRPQEFVPSLGFRPVNVDHGTGFIEYAISLQSRESWQKVNEVLQSKASVSNFCMEVQRKLGIKSMYETESNTTSSTKGDVDDDDNNNQDVESKKGRRSSKIAFRNQDLIQHEPYLFMRSDEPKKDR